MEISSKIWYLINLPVFSKFKHQKLKNLAQIEKLNEFVRLKTRALSVISKKMKHLFLILLILKFAFTYVFADVINDVQVKNNNRITKETIITFGGIEFGKDYSDEQLNKILLDLYSTNFFSDIKFNIKNNVLIVDVKERKLFNKSY